MFFILTTGRSGSKSIARFLSSSPDAACFHEPHPALIHEATDYLYGEMRHSALVRLLIETRPASVDGKEYGESNQKLSFIVPALRDAFGICKFVWLVRDGRDMVSSAWSLGWYDPGLREKNAWFRALPEAPKLGSMAQAAWDALGAFEKCCWYWSFTNACIGKGLLHVPQEQWIRLRVEELYRERRRLARFLGIAPPEEPLKRINLKLDKKTNSQTSWRFWSHEQRSVFCRLCGDMMDRLYPGWTSRGGVWREVVRPPLPVRLLGPGTFPRAVGRVVFSVGGTARLKRAKTFFSRISGME